MTNEHDENEEYRAGQAAARHDGGRQLHEAYARFSYTCLQRAIPPGEYSKLYYAGYLDATLLMLRPVGEVARLTGLNPATIRRYVYAGTVRAVRWPHKALRVDLAQLRALIADGTITPGKRGRKRGPAIKEA